MKRIITTEGINMTLVEKNITEWAEELGLKDEYIKKGIKEGEYHKAIETATEMLKDNMSIESICKYTKLSIKVVRNLQKTCKYFPVIPYAAPALSFSGFYRQYSPTPIQRIRNSDPLFDRPGRRLVLAGDEDNLHQMKFS